MYISCIETRHVYDKPFNRNVNCTVEISWANFSIPIKIIFLEYLNEVAWNHLHDQSNTQISCRFQMTSGRIHTLGSLPPTAVCFIWFSVSLTTSAFKSFLEQDLGSSYLKCQHYRCWGWRVPSFKPAYKDIETIC